MIIKYMEFNKELKNVCYKCNINLYKNIVYQIQFGDGFCIHLCEWW